MSPLPPPRYPELDHDTEIARLMKEYGISEVDAEIAYQIGQGQIPGDAVDLDQYPELDDSQPRRRIVPGF